MAINKSFSALSFKYSVRKEPKPLAAPVIIIFLLGYSINKILFLKLAVYYLLYFFNTIQFDYFIIGKRNIECLLHSYNQHHESHGIPYFHIFEFHILTDFRYFNL